MNIFLSFLLIDLAYTLTPDIPTWNLSCGYESAITLDYDQCEGPYKFRLQNMTLKAGTGTHMDAPAHCIPGGLDIPNLPLESLMVPCIVIDISSKAHQRYSLSVADIQEFEAMHGIIAKGVCVLLQTGWHRFWNDKEKYHNNLLFPSISPEAAQLLVERGVVAVGIDTMSPDREEDGFPVHNILLSNKIYIIENVANADQLTPTGSYIIALPLKGEGLTESPVPLIGLVKK